MRWDQTNIISIARPAVLVMSVWLISALGCTSQSGTWADSGTVPEAPDGSMGDSAAPTVTASSCRSSGSDSCFCEEGTVGDLATCTPDSVSTGIKEGACCKEANTCLCRAYQCYTSKTGHCYCGTVTPFSEGSTVAKFCGKAASSDHCCFKAATSRTPPSCSCSAVDCREGETEVSSCAVADVKGCESNSTLIGRCTP